MKAVVLIALLFAAPAVAQDTTQAARAASERLAAAAVLLDSAASSSDRVGALTETVRAYEDGLVALREGLRRVAIRRRALQAELDARQAEVSQLLGVLQTMGRAPAPLLLLHPSGPLGTARSGMMVAEVTPALQAQVDRLRTDLDEIRRLQALQDSAAGTLQDGLAGAQEARAALSLAISERRDLPVRYIEDPVRTALLIASTETLDAFAGGLAGVVDTALAGTAPDARSLQGSLPLPVQGTIIRGFGQADAAGTVRPGWIVAARPRAMVTSPAPATIRFLGPLLDYGNVVILEPSPDVLIVLAGLAEVFGEAGQVIDAGTPVGLMGGELPGVDAILTQSAESGAGPQSQTLYLEVRDGQSVSSAGPGRASDPADWFATP